MTDGLIIFDAPDLNFQELIVQDEIEPSKNSSPANENKITFIKTQVKNHPELIYRRMRQREALDVKVSKMQRVSKIYRNTYQRPKIFTQAAIQQRAGKTTQNFLLKNKMALKFGDGKKSGEEIAQAGNPDKKLLTHQTSVPRLEAGGENK